MTGLEKIVEQIMQEAKTASEQEIAKTQKEVDQILANAKSKREASHDGLIADADAAAQQLLQRGESAASLQERKLLLMAKQQIINQIFEEAADSILKLPDAEYFKLLLQMVDRYALPEDGSIHMSKQDLDRMPTSFETELGSRKITIIKEPAKIHGGFILSYGDIEENCTFDALISANRETLQDQIVSLIF